MFTPIGPYSHVSRAGPFITISGTPGVVPATSQMAGPDAYSQARQIVHNFRSMLADVGASLGDVMHVHVFLKRVEDFQEMNRAYAEAFGSHRPARTVICVADLPKAGALMTMNLTAFAQPHNALSQPPERPAPMETTRQSNFNNMAAALGYSFEGEIKIGGNYASTVRNGNDIYVSGQIPRVGSTVVVTGRVGTDVSLADAQKAAKVCAMRALAVLAQALGSLDRIQQVLRIGVYVQSAEDFTQQSEVADAASEVFHTVLGPSGVHTRTSVGVFQLPKNAAVELDLIATVSGTD